VALKTEKEGHLHDKEMVRLTLETDRLSLKSAYEVRIELLTQEKDKVQQACELLKGENAKLKNENALLTLQVQNDPEKIRLLD
jgi:hypothetical protein